MQRWPQAVSLLSRAAASASSPASAVALRVRLAKALSADGQHAAAVEAYDLALQAARAAPLSQSQRQQAAPSLAAIKALSAEPLYALGAKDAAVTLVMRVLDEDPALPEGLLQYARIAADRGMTGDAIRALLRLMVANSALPEPKLLLAKCLRDPTGLDCLLKELGGTSGAANASSLKPNLAPALAYVATAVKEHGALEAAAELYRRAVALAPSSGSYALNLCHTLEAAGALEEALASLQAFFQRAGGSKACVGPLRLAALQPLAALPPLAALQAGSDSSILPYDSSLLP